MKVNVGTAPDSWGVWFPVNENQIHWSRFLDEVAEAGYKWIELGPLGYLPTDFETLKRELDARDLKISGTFIQAHLEDKNAWPETERLVRETAELLHKLDSQFLIIIDQTYSDFFTGVIHREKKINNEGWDTLVEATNKVCRIARNDYGLKGVFHQHAETHVEYPDDLERLLTDTDPSLVSFCLDTGHFAYRYGDPVKVMRKYHARIPYLHLKSVDSIKRDEVNKGDITFGKAVEKDMFVEPQLGIVDFKAFRDALEDVNYEGFGIVEQDMYPAPFDKPLPIAKRTRAYLQEIGIG